MHLTGPPCALPPWPMSCPRCSGSRRKGWGCSPCKTSSPSTAREYQALIQSEILPKLSRLKVAAVNHTDIDRLQRKMSERVPYRANRTLALWPQRSVKYGGRSQPPDFVSPCGAAAGAAPPITLKRAFCSSVNEL